MIEAIQVEQEQTKERRPIFRVDFRAMLHPDCRPDIERNGFLMFGAEDGIAAFERANNYLQEKYRWHQFIAVKEWKADSPEAAALTITEADLSKLSPGGGA